MRCLLVDDEPGIREGLAALLRLRGHEVRTAGDCRAATQLLREHEFDLVLTDWRLPDGTGALLYGLGRAPIIAISGHPEEIEPSPRLLTVLAKPVAPDDLLRLVAAQAERATPTATARPIASLPGDVRTVLERALALIGDAAAEVVDDGTFVTLRAAWPGESYAGRLAALGGDLRVLTPAGRAVFELRWFRDGRPCGAAVAVRAGAPWPETGVVAVDFHDTAVDAIGLADIVAAARARNGTAAGRVWLVNLPESLREDAAHLGLALDGLVPAAIGPRVPELFEELWR